VDEILGRPGTLSAGQKEHSITTFTTALVMLGPTGIGPFSSQDWRVAPDPIQLVEAGTNGPGLLAGRHYLSIDSLDSEFVFRAFVLMAANLTDVQHVKDYLRETHNLVQDDSGIETTARYWDIADEVLEWCAPRMAEFIRIGIVRLDDMTLADDALVERFRAYGFMVDVFERVPLPETVGAQMSEA